MREWNSYEEYCNFLDLEEQERKESNKYRQLEELTVWADENNIPEDRLPRDVKKLKYLTELNLSPDYWCWMLTTLPESIGSLTNLTSLDISGNQLKKLPESIRNLTNLISLNISRNELTELPEWIGNLTNLISMDISINELTELPQSIGNLINLNELAFNNNQLIELTNSIGKLTNLTKLNIHDSTVWFFYVNNEERMCRKMLEFIGDLTNLTSLWIDKDTYSYLPDSVKNNPNLTIHKT